MSALDRCKGFLRGPCELPMGHDGRHHSALDGEWARSDERVKSPARASNPPPKPERPDLPAVWDLVRADILERDRVGRERYGTPLQPRNGRDALLDAYQEGLDLVVYLRQAIWERDNPPPARP